MNRFAWYEFRSKNIERACAFYTEVIGADIRDERGVRTVRLGGALIGEITPLPAQAIARGAPAHWLGHLAVQDLDAAAARLAERGAERLGPLRHSGAGDRVLTFRDPFGAAVALSSSSARDVGAGIPWHELHTADRDGSASLYTTLFGWQLRDRYETQHVGGPYQTFAWDAQSEPQGAVFESLRQQGVHPHWMMYFAVGNLDRAVEHAVAQGGLVCNAPVVMPFGGRCAQLDDAEGAAFGLIQRV